MRRPWLVGALAGMLTRKTLSLSPLLRRQFATTTSSIGGGVAVKKVTGSNFESALEGLRIHVRESDFVAFDLEMTGVTSAPWRESFEFDRSDVRYLKVKDSAEKFAVVQVGVCPFRWDHSKESFIAHPHNFYVFPRKELPIDGPSYEFLCQTTSIDFLTKYQFDFNAWIYEGISYLSRAQEVEAICALSSAYDNILVSSPIDFRESVDIPIVSTADVLFLERMKNRFHEWRIRILKDPSEDSLRGNPDSSKPQFQTIFYKMRPAVLLSGFSSHQLKMIQLVIRKHFNNLVFVRASCADLSGKKIVVYAESVDDKALLMKEVQEDLKKMTEAKIRSAVGFRHVIDLLVSEQKLVIGHNCFLDIAHLYSKFFGSLPSSITEFASSMHKIFPYIADTRHLMNAPVIQHLMKKNSKSLSSAFALLCPQILSASYSATSASHPSVKVEVQTDDTGSSCWNSGANHEAGYDAFMTGCVFAQACSHLGIDFKLNSSSMELVGNDKLQNHINRLYLGWNSGTVINLTTGSELLESNIQGVRQRYPKIVFENIVILWGFPSKFKPKELKECICKVFDQSSVTSIFYLDSTAAFIQFSKRELVTDFLLLKDSLERNNDAVSVLHPLVELLEGGNTRAAGYEVYKQVCSSSVSKVLFVDQAEAVVGIRWKTKFEPVEVVDTDELAKGRESSTGSVVEPVTGKRRTDGGRERHHLTCEEILDSFYASKSLFGRRTST